MKPGFAARWRADREGLTALAVLAVLLVLPLFVPSWQLLQLSKFFSYMLLAASLAWVWGHCGLLCLGQGVFFGVGAYGMSVVTLGKLPFMAGPVWPWAWVWRYCWRSCWAGCSSTPVGWAVRFSES